MYTQTDIDHWKTIYDDIFQQHIDDQVFIFRPIGRMEYQGIIDDEISFGDTQEEVCRIVTLYPEDFDWDSKAGYADTLFSHVMDLSGLVPGQARDILSLERSRMMVFDHQADCIIHEAFPEFSIEQIENWTVARQMRYLARAEFILMELRGVPLQMMKAIQEENPQQQGEQKEPETGEKRELSKEEVETMLSAKAGHKISLDDATQFSSKPGSFPELAFFATQDTLKGEFD